MSALDALVYFNHNWKSITFANGSTYGDLIDILGRTLKIDFTKLCIQLWDDTYKVYLDLDEEYFDEVKDLIHKSLSEKAFSISFRFIRRAFPCPLPKTPRAITRQPSADKSADCQFDEPDTDGDLYDPSKIYDLKPESYLSHLIGHEGEGSLLTLLKRRGLASELVVGEKNNASGTGLSQ
ncbi:unnamed protein product [Didymodactylos carnosus]|uniref:Uncharacterized protein n=1 Tax=Didymodactylos carnosus TaxID=1234261 RepID=A0A813XEE7_9BILA|nr:unnamed protein product [Didymodactylos carnosus]CAF3653217.1 unnamed protein product [Didymodactylos carnosus]